MPLFFDDCTPPPNFLLFFLQTFSRTFESTPESFASMRLVKDRHDRSLRREISNRGHREKAIIRPSSRSFISSHSEWHTLQEEELPSSSKPWLTTISQSDS